VAADLRGDLLGSENSVAVAPPVWLRPGVLWAGILAGPLAWSADLAVSYALVKWTCSTQRTAVLHLITVATLAVVALGAAIAWQSRMAASSAGSTDGGRPIERAQFMALLGLATSAFFFTVVIAEWLPQWVLDACH